VLQFAQRFGDGDLGPALRVAFDGVFEKSLECSFETFEKSSPMVWLRVS
jgi:hypothetical protein